MVSCVHSNASNHQYDFYNQESNCSAHYSSMENIQYQNFASKLKNLQKSFSFNPPWITIKTQNFLFPCTIWENVFCFQSPHCAFAFLAFDKKMCTFRAEWFEIERHCRRVLIFIRVLGMPVLPDFSRFSRSFSNPVIHKSHWQLTSWRPRWWGRREISVWRLGWHPDRKPKWMSFLLTCPKKSFWRKGSGPYWQITRTQPYEKLLLKIVTNHSIFHIVISWIEFLRIIEARMDIWN